MWCLFKTVNSCCSVVQLPQNKQRNFSIFSLSLTNVKVKVDFGTEKGSCANLWRVKIEPQPDPSPPSSLWPFHAKIFLFLCWHCTLFDIQGQDSTAHMGACGSTPCLEDGVGRQRNEDPPVGQDCNDDDPLPSSGCPCCSLSTCCIRLQCNADFVQIS